MEGPSLDVSSASLDIFMMALALSGSLVPGRRWWASSPGPAGELDLALVQNWGTSLIFMQNGSEQLAGLLPLFLCFLLSFTPPTPHSAECGDLCSPPVQASCPCALFFPENCQLFIPPSGLCRPGGSCLLTSLAAFLGLLRSGLAGWSPSLRCTLPGHVLVTPLLLLFCTLRSFYE